MGTALAAAEAATASSAAGPSGLAVPGQETAADTLLSHEELVADVGRLADFFERTHPAPYGEEGRLGFQRRLHRLLRELPEEGVDREAFHGLLQPFLAPLGDGHTQVLPLREAEGGASQPGLPLDLQILAAGETTAVPGLFVRGTAGGEAIAPGSRLEAVAGVPAEEIIARERRWEGYENEFGNLQNLIHRLSTARGLRELLPEWDGGDDIRIRLRSPDGTVSEPAVARGSPPRSWEGESASSAVELPAAPAGIPAWRFLDSAGRVALLRLDNTWAYRETFESLVKTGSGQLAWAQSLYRRLHGDEPPQDTAALVEAFPAATSLLTELVEEMRRARTETLIVDLRRNSGGTSTLVNMLLYFLHGREGWGEFFGNFHTIRRLTEADVAGIDSARAGRFPYRVGDYDFSGVFDAEGRSPSEAGSEGYFRATTISFAGELESGAHEAYYAPPEVRVVVGPRTYSGGFWVAAALRRMGAKLVGVPAGQAGNAFGHVRYETLEHSGIRIGVSSRIFRLFPEEPAGMQVLPVDVALTPERWRETGYDPNASILLALEADGE